MYKNRKNAKELSSRDDGKLDLLLKNQWTLIMMGFTNFQSNGQECQRKHLSAKFPAKDQVRKFEAKCEEIDDYAAVRIYVLAYPPKGQSP